MSVLLAISIVTENDIVFILILFHCGGKNENINRITQNKIPR